MSRIDAARPAGCGRWPPGTSLLPNECLPTVVAMDHHGVVACKCADLLERDGLRRGLDDEERTGASAGSIRARRHCSGGYICVRWHIQFPCTTDPPVQERH